MMAVAWPPAPRQLPELRADLARDIMSPGVLAAMMLAIDSGNSSVLPVWDPPGPLSPGQAAAPLLVNQEFARLRTAELFYVSSDMVGLTLAAATTTPKETVRRSRLPADCGFMVFAEPIGGFSQQLAGTGETITIPVVAASWATWSPSDVTMAEIVDTTGLLPGTLRWQHVDRSLLPHLEGVWITFYAHPAMGYATLPSGSVVTDHRGRGLTAGEIRDLLRGRTLQWENETVLVFGSTLDEPAPGTPAAWTQVLYTAWQLMTQHGKPLTEVEEHPRDRHGAKRDRRAGIAPGGVKIVRLHQPTRPATAGTEPAGDGTTPDWSCRWPVRPHRRDQCLNPRAHGSGGCEHEERLIPAHLKGPPDKPLRVPKRVILWDTPPDS